MNFPTSKHGAVSSSSLPTIQTIVDYVWPESVIIICPVYDQPARAHRATTVHPQLLHGGVQTRHGLSVLRPYRSTAAEVGVRIQRLKYTYMMLRIYMKSTIIW